MSLVDILGSQLGTEGVEMLGQKLGLDPAATQQAVAAAIPMLTGALAHNAAQPGGAAALNQALDAHDGSILDQIGGYLGGGGASGAASGIGGGLPGPNPRPPPGKTPPRPAHPPRTAPRPGGPPPGHPGPPGVGGPGP